jgi:hypothetical protein
MTEFFYPCILLFNLEQGSFLSQSSRSQVPVCWIENIVQMGEFGFRELFWVNDRHLIIGGDQSHLVG